MATRKLAREIVNEVLDFDESSEERAVNGYSRAFKNDAVDIVERILKRTALTRFERDVLAQALTDYSAGVDESDYGDENPRAYARTERALESIERKLLGGG